MNLVLTTPAAENSNSISNQQILVIYNKQLVKKKALSKIKVRGKTTAPDQKSESIETFDFNFRETVLRLIRKRSCSKARKHKSLFQEDVPRPKIRKHKGFHQEDRSKGENPKAYSVKAQTHVISSLMTTRHS
ncbi:8767_t:CDS:2, partial [Paraglomus occultum]